MSGSIASRIITERFRLFAWERLAGFAHLCKAAAWPGGIKIKRAILWSSSSPSSAAIRARQVAPRLARPRPPEKAEVGLAVSNCHSLAIRERQLLIGHANLREIGAPLNGRQQRPSGVSDSSAVSCPVYLIGHSEFRRLVVASSSSSSSHRSHLSMPSLPQTPANSAKALQCLTAKPRLRGQ